MKFAPTSCLPDDLEEAQSEFAGCLVVRNEMPN